MGEERGDGMKGWNPQPLPCSSLSPPTHLHDPLHLHLQGEQHLRHRLLHVTAPLPPHTFMICSTSICRVSSTRGTASSTSLPPSPPTPS